MMRHSEKPAATLTGSPLLNGTARTQRLFAGGLLAGLLVLLGPGCSQDDPSDRLSLAASAIATGDARTAAGHYQDAAALSPSDSFIRWQFAKALLTIRDGKGAEKQIRAATKLGIDDERTRPALAHALFLQGKYREVLDLSVGGFSKLPAANILAYQARAQIELGDLETAQAVLRKAAKLSRYSADVFFAEAELAFAQGDQQTALEALQNVQLVERDYPYTPARLGQIALAEGDAPAAERYFSDAAELHYGPWQDLLNRGIARLQQGKHEQAREDAEALLAQLPDEAEVQLFAYQVYANQDDLSQARAALERALQLGPDHASAQLALARMELQSGNTAGAESLSRTALRLQPAYTPARELLALLLLDQKRPNEALEIIQPAVEADPDDARLKRILAYCYFETQRYDDLSTLDEQLENHLDKDAYTRFSRGLRLLQSGEEQAAIDLIGPTIAIGADDLEPYDPLELDLHPTPAQAHLVQAEAPDETVLDVVSVAAVEDMARVDSPQADLVALPGPVTVAASTIEEPVSVVSQPQITGIEPAVVSAQVPPPDLSPVPSEQASPPEVPPIEVGLVVETPTDEPVEETPATPLPNTDTNTEPDSIAVSHVENFVHEWAAAWSRQDVEAYLLHYADDFRPADGSSHAIWKEQRRERLMRPKSISVEISELEVIPLDAQHVQARFVQAYRANHYRDRVSKALYLMRVGSDWRIVQEVSL